MIGDNMSLPLWQAERILTARQVFNAGLVDEAERVVKEADMGPNKPEAPKAPEASEEIEDPEIPEIP